ncbi:MAG: hypothetical protein MZW92_20485 [Comamonadaceae bacterium]|nr:hypothetical protein [Comamonadaceae bacterium]
MSKQMLLMELACPQCGATLTDGTQVRLDAHVRETHQRGRDPAVGDLRRLLRRDRPRDRGRR